MENVIHCIAKDRHHAESIVASLIRGGVSESRISVVFADKSDTQDFAHEQHTALPESSASGLATGMGVGAALGCLAGIGSLAIPGIGPFIAAGPIMAALAGALVTGAAGGFIGVLVGMGIPEYDAVLYDAKIRDGSALLAVHADHASQEADVREIFSRAESDAITSTTAETVP